MLLGRVLRKPDNGRTFRRQLVYEMKVLGIDSLPIACIISAFVGAAVVIQFAASLSNPIYPTWITLIPQLILLVITVITFILAMKKKPSAE